MRGSRHWKHLNIIFAYLGVQTDVAREQWHCHLSLIAHLFEILRFAIHRTCIVHETKLVLELENNYSKKHHVFSPQTLHLNLLELCFWTFEISEAYAVFIKNISTAIQIQFAAKLKDVLDKSSFQRKNHCLKGRRSVIFVFLFKVRLSLGHTHWCSVPCLYKGPWHLILSASKANYELLVRVSTGAKKAKIDKCCNSDIGSARAPLFSSITLKLEADTEHSERIYAKTKIATSGVVIHEEFLEFLGWFWHL